MKAAAEAGTKVWATSMRKRAKELVRQLDENSVDLGIILFHVWSTPIEGVATNPPVFKSWGYDSFRDYAEKELGMDLRKAERLRSIGYLLETELAGIAPELRKRLVGLGWSKLSELARVLRVKHTQSFVEKWVERAEESSYPELRLAVSSALEKLIHVDGKPATFQPSTAPVDDKMDTEASEEDDPDPEDAEDGEDAAELGSFEDDTEGLPEPHRTKAIHFLLADEQIDNVLEALERAAELIHYDTGGQRSKSARLSLIALDFLANNDWKGAHNPETRKRFLAKLEMAMGIKLIGIDEKNNVFYGLLHLKNLADK